MSIRGHQEKYKMKAGGKQHDRAFRGKAEKWEGAPRRSRISRGTRSPK